MEAAAAMLKWIKTVVVLLEGHMQGVLASMKGLDDFSSWCYRCYHMEHLWVAYIDPRHGHALTSSPLLKELLDSAPHGGYLTNN